MLRLIGLVVVIIVVVLGWPQIHRWYDGNISGKQAVGEIRDKVGNEIITDEQNRKKHTND
jgi:hypothetical protein